MFNEIHIGPVTVYMYGIMMAIGFFTALRLCLSRGMKIGLAADRIWGVFYCALIGGLVGAKALFLITEIRYITYMCIGWMPMVLPMITLVVESSSACAIVKTEYAPKPPTE